MIPEDPHLCLTIEITNVIVPFEACVKSLVGDSEVSLHCIN